MSGTFEIYKDNANEFRFRLKASNGENLLASEGYTAKSSAENGIKSVKENAPIGERFEKKTSGNDKPFFVLKAAKRNHRKERAVQLDTRPRRWNRGRPTRSR